MMISVGIQQPLTGKKGLAQGARLSKLGMMLPVDLQYTL